MNNRKFILIYLLEFRMKLINTKSSIIICDILQYFTLLCIFYNNLLLLKFIINIIFKKFKLIKIN